MVILQAIQDFGNWFWGIPILILIGGGGLFLTIYLGFPQIRHFGYAMSQTFGKMFAKKEEGKVRPISAAFAALACAVGASNIVGVPVAIALGGPGAVFWIWILAIFGMCTKYCEVAMGIKYRRKNDVGEWVGGPRLLPARSGQEDRRRVRHRLRLLLHDRAGPLPGLSGRFRC